MLRDPAETIVAVASPPGLAPRGVVRVSGARAWEICQTCFQADSDASLARLDRGSSTRLEGTLCLPPPWPAITAAAWVWPGARSYTRQPTVELQLPGSPPLLEATIKALCLAGAHPARPGEFTLRAFLAGRLDLPQAEAVLAVIHAREPDELHHALTQLAGGLSHPLAELRNALLNDLADLEAGLDFSDEDIAFITPDVLTQRLDHALQVVHHAQQALSTRSRGDAVPRVLLMGPPNAGKSTLFNALVGKQRSLTSPSAHTTRDYVVERMWLDEAFPVDFVDTAGMVSLEPGQGSASDSFGAELAALAAEGAALARPLLETCDLVLVCLPPQAGAESIQSLLPTRGDLPRIWLQMQADQAAGVSQVPQALPVSGLTGAGLPELKAELMQALQHSPWRQHTTQSPLGPQTAVCLQQAEQSLVAALDLLHPQSNSAPSRPLAETSSRSREPAWELIAGELRTALQALGEVTGAVVTEEILDRLFSRFCIGK